MTHVRTETCCVACGQACDVGTSRGGTTHWYIPKKGKAKKNERACLVCGGKMRHMRLPVGDPPAPEKR